MLDLIKKVIRPYYTQFIHWKQEKLFSKLLDKSKGKSLKLAVGSSGIFEEGWIPSEAHFLNLLEEDTWDKYFKKDEVDCIIAEHVLEHLTLEQGEKTAQVCHKYLKSGGWFRVAVPDGYHKNKDYIDYVKPGGNGAGADDHKVLYNYKSLSSIFEKNGYEVKLLEYFDENHQFQYIDWDEKSGMIRRSIRFDERNKNGEPNYTSLIIDAIKK